MKRFNIMGICIPELHYMADISEQLDEIEDLIVHGDYFTMNRARQYGKTTTLGLLERRLNGEELVIFISFEGVGTDPFSSEKDFVNIFQRLVRNELEHLAVESEIIQKWMIESDSAGLFDLSEKISWLCRTINKKIILLIDEVDKSSDNQIFLSFLGMLREKYLSRMRRPTFHSVVLAGVYDVKNLKLKLRPKEERKFNSPWNIAANFNVDMSLSVGEISSMLVEYEEDYHTGMDIGLIAKSIRDYTSGYPFLVSRICLMIHEDLDQDWAEKGVRDAVKNLLQEDNTLFDDIFKNLENSKELYDFMYDVLVRGKVFNYIPDNPTMKLALLFGFIKNVDGRVWIHNKIFEMRMVNYFISKETPSEASFTNQFKNEVTRGGVFDLELCMKKFAEHYRSIYTQKDQKYLERECKLLFLTYLRPLINGVGFYALETQTSDELRMDVVVFYMTNRYIIELKIWHGGKRHKEAYQQLLDYMDAQKEQDGYLLTFDFRKQRESSAQWVEIGGKRIFDVIV